jgi:hypothetical protein
MFDKKKPIPPVAVKIQQQLREMAEPLPMIETRPARPLLEALRAQKAEKERELEKALKLVEELTNEVRAFRHEEVWLTVNPEFDSVYSRLSNGKANAAKA